MNFPTSSHATDWVLGIDPGIRRTGWGLVARESGRLLCVGCGIIKPKGDDLGQKLHSLMREISRIAHLHQPKEAAVEDIFYHANARSAFILGQARGVALAALASLGLFAASYPPAMVKRVVSGTGTAGKPQVARAIEAILHVRAPSDAVDALAVGICHVLAGGAGRVLRARR